MNSEVTVALIAGLLSLCGTILLAFTSARKDELDILRGIIAELKEKVQNLQEANDDLEDWAERLVCQVKELGAVPAKFIKHSAKEPLSAWEHGLKQERK